jgi:SHS2 domain-containing protein
MDFLHDNELKATVRGERYQSTKHDLQVDVKAITYHKLIIEKHDDFWLARVFVDI